VNSASSRSAEMPPALMYRSSSFGSRKKNSTLLVRTDGSTREGIYTDSRRPEGEKIADFARPSR
jgi:hypothetical protein